MGSGVHAFVLTDLAYLASAVCVLKYFEWNGGGVKERRCIEFSLAGEALWVAAPQLPPQSVTASRPPKAGN